MHVYNCVIMLYLYLLLTLTHSDVGKPVQLDISFAYSHCFRMFITTIQGLYTNSNGANSHYIIGITVIIYHVLILEHFV